MNGVLMEFGVSLLYQFYDGYTHNFIAVEIELSFRIIMFSEKISLIRVYRSYFKTKRNICKKYTAKALCPSASLHA